MSFMVLGMEQQEQKQLQWGTGATATPMAMGQRSIDQSIERRRSINQFGMGHWGTGAGAKGATEAQWGNGNDRLFPLRSIVWMWGAWGAGVGILFRVLFETLVNAKTEVRIIQ
jgi:hypothetical protein